MEKKLSETSLVLPVTPAFIERRIFLIRGQKVMLDSDLAELYQVETKALNRAVQRNVNRFPKDFMLQLTSEEFKNLKYQFGTSSWGGKRKLPYVFTELGVAMLSSVLNSEKAIQMNVFILRAFMKLREMLSTHKDLAEKIEVLEKEQREQGKDISLISKAINKLLVEKEKLRSAIGFEI